MEPCKITVLSNSEALGLLNRYSMPHDPVVCTGSPVVSNMAGALGLHPWDLVALDTHDIP